MSSFDQGFVGHLEKSFLGYRWIKERTRFVVGHVQRSATVEDSCGGSVNFVRKEIAWSKSWGIVNNEVTAE